MRLLILGATGRTGSEVVDLALARGHEVTAFVRSPEKVERVDKRLVVKQGDVLDVDRLSRALTGQDAVVSALGLPARKALRPSTFMAEAAAATVAAMKWADVHRIAVVSAAVLFPVKGLVYRFFRWLLKHHARDLDAMETVIRAADLDWTIARPPRLVRKSDEQRRIRVGGLPEKSYSLSFRALAVFLLDCVEEGNHPHEVVGVAR